MYPCPLPATEVYLDKGMAEKRLRQMEAEVVGVSDTVATLQTCMAAVAPAGDQLSLLTVNRLPVYEMRPDGAVVALGERTVPNTELG